MEDIDTAQFEELITMLVWRQRRRFGQTLSALGLTMPQFLALTFVHARGGQCSMGELAGATEQCSATMTGIVDRLANMGLARRRRDPNDRRSVLVELTGEGQALLVRAKANRTERAAQILQHFSLHERAELMQFLVRYLEILADDSVGLAGE